MPTQLTTFAYNTNKVGPYKHGAIDKNGKTTFFGKPAEIIGHKEDRGYLTQVILKLPMEGEKTRSFVCRLPKGKFICEQLPDVAKKLSKLVEISARELNNWDHGDTLRISLDKKAPEIVKKDRSQVGCEWTRQDILYQVGEGEMAPLDMISHYCEKLDITAKVGQAYQDAITCPGKLSVNYEAEVLNKALKLAELQIHPKSDQVRISHFENAMKELRNPFSTLPSEKSHPRRVKVKNSLPTIVEEESQAVESKTAVEEESQAAGSKTAESKTAVEKESQTESQTVVEEESQTESQTVVEEESQTESQTAVEEESQAANSKTAESKTAVEKESQTESQTAVEEESQTAESKTAVEDKSQTADSKTTESKTAVEEKSQAAEANTAELKLEDAETLYDNLEKYIKKIADRKSPFLMLFEQDFKKCEQEVMDLKSKLVSLRKESPEEQAQLLPGFGEEMRRVDHSVILVESKVLSKELTTRLERRAGLFTGKRLKKRIEPIINQVKAIKTDLSEDAGAAINQQYVRKVFKMAAEISEQLNSSRFAVSVKNIDFILKREAE